MAPRQAPTRTSNATSKKTYSRLVHGSKTHGKLRLLGMLSLLGAAGFGSPLAEFSLPGLRSERLVAQEPASSASKPPITVATEEERNQKIAEDWESPWLVFYITGIVAQARARWSI